YCASAARRSMSRCWRRCSSWRWDLPCCSAGCCSCACAPRSPSAGCAPCASTAKRQRVMLARHPAAPRGRPGADSHGCARDICLDGRLCRVRVACLRDRRGGAGWARATILATLPGEPGRAPKCRAAGAGPPMTVKLRRLVTLLAGLVAVSAATALVLAAFSDNLVFFYSPTDLAAKNVAPERRIRIGGLVETDSVKKQIDGHAVAFRVTDGQTELRVVYDGILPDLFREGQGGVGEGKMGREKTRQVPPSIARGFDLFAADRKHLALHLAPAEALVKKAPRIVAQHPDDRRAAALIYEPLEQCEQEPPADPLILPVGGDIEGKDLAGEFRLAM